ncbi:MAG: hypothetical protein GY751_18895, partial [Bacteroidetes bacterium]|nr:hypothetical protein [Bacteroidota bacterium]
FLWFTPKYHGGLSLRFEYLFFAVLRKNSYFQTNWWSLKASAILAIPLFIAVIFMNERVDDYYSYFLTGGLTRAILLKGGFAFWYLNIIHVLYFVLLVLLAVESVRMHKWAAPVRFAFCSILVACSGILSLLSIILIVLASLFYLILRWVRNLIFGSPAPIDHSLYVIRSWNPVVTDYRLFAFDLYYKDELWEDQQTPVIDKMQHPEQRIAPERDQSLPQFHPD